MDDRGEYEAPDACIPGSFDNAYPNFGLVWQKCRGDIENPIHILHGGSDTHLVSKVADHSLGGPSRLRRLDFIRTSDEAAHLCAAFRKLRNDHPGELPGSANG